MDVGNCIMCGTLILANDVYTGAKGDYAHSRCHIQNESAFDRDLDEERAEVEFQRGYNAGYTTAYEHGRRDGIRVGETQDQAMLDQMRAILDKCQVPAIVDQHYGVGQAARLAWLLDRTGYTIEELGNPP